MAGDVIDIFGKSYYFQNNANDNTGNNLIASNILAALLSTPGGAVTAAHGAVTASQISPISGTDVGSFLQNNRTPVTSSTPRAYINYIILDDHFKYVSGGISAAGSNTVVKDHHNDGSMQNISIPKNGYIYVYCSNESPVDVFFDNLQVVHTRGPLVEENHYYPFGLDMAAIGSKAAGSVLNKRKFNGGTELDSDFAINIYETSFRGYDAQIGRFGGIDALSETDFDLTPYHYGANDPNYWNDPSGLSLAGPAVESNPFGGMSMWGWVGFHTGYWGDAGGSSWLYSGGSGFGSFGFGSSGDFASSGGGGGGRTVRGFEPMTTEDLRAYGRSGSIDRGRTPLEFNRYMGKMFEEAVLELFPAIGKGTFISSKERQRASLGKRKGVIPDGMGIGIHSQGGIANFLIEVKAVNGTLTLSYNDYQIMGEIDAAASLKTGDAVPQLTFVTTQNTLIGESIKGYAEKRGVFLSQYIVKWDGEGTIMLSAPIQLNMFNRPFLNTLVPGTSQLIGPPQPDNAFDQEEVEDIP